MAGCPEYPAVPACCHIAAGPSVGFLNSAGGENPLLLNENGASSISAVLVLPDARGDIFDGVDDILRPVGADQPVWPLCGIATDRQRRIDKQIEPIDRLLDPGATLGPNRAIVFAARQDLLHRVGRPC